MTSGERPSNLTPAELQSAKWTIDTIYIHFLRIIEDLDRRIQERFESGDRRTEIAMAASEKAISKAEAASDKRFDSVNEFRQTLTDQANHFMPRGEFAARLETIDKSLSALTLRVQASESRGQGLQSGWAILIAVATIAILTIGVFWKRT